ncbi:MAG: hypothetical protein II124_07490 [Clostridia bacterium]|nr:hypothetical protein [Clostridia bacterium]
MTNKGKRSFSRRGRISPNCIIGFFVEKVKPPTAAGTACRVQKLEYIFKTGNARVNLAKNNRSPAALRPFAPQLPFVFL